jgi:L-asparaginase
LLPAISCITTGGTISMRYDPNLGGAVPAVSGDELIRMVPGLDDVAHVELNEFANLPSCHITPQLIFKLCEVIRKTLDRDDVDGVVVTHGTDGLEETAYMADLLLDPDKPLVFTAAMRNNSELGADGPRNLLAAVRVAACPDAGGMGALIVFNGRILAARDTIKLHTSNLDAYRSPMLGPLGNVDDQLVTMYRTSLVRQHIAVDYIVPEVLLVKVCSGTESDLLDWALAQGYRGLVIEAMGQGNVPPMMLPGIDAWLAAGKPVVLVSRCQEGRALDTYAYPGGGKQLRDMGVIFGEDLTGPKARIKLMLALAATQDVEKLRSLFEYLG